MPDTSDSRVPAPQQELEVLASTIRSEHQGVAHAAANLIEHALAAGDALIKAKEKVGHGAWLPWLKKECDLSEDRAERYMRIARGRAVLEANSARMRNLSLAGALQLLKPSGSSTPSSRTAKKSAASFDALGWWSTAPLEQRRHLLDSAGCMAVREALPPAWRDSTGIASKPSSTAVTVADAGEGIGRDDIGANSSSENERLRARVEELEHEKGRIEDLKAAQPLTEQSAEQLLELLELKIKRTSKTRRAFKDLRKELPRPPQLELAAGPTADATLPAITTGSLAFVNDEIFDGYTKWPLEKLEERILWIQRSAGHGAHLTQKQWKTVDRMRDRADELKRALVASVQAQGGSTMGATRH